MHNGYSTQALYNLGIEALRKGQDEKAFDLFSRSVEGYPYYPLSEFELGKMLLRGIGTSGSRDTHQARKCFTRVVQHLGNHIDALTTLAKMLAQGDGGEKDDEEATRLYIRAAKLGQVEAQYIAGVRIAAELGIKRNETSQSQVIAFIKSAAEKGHADAQYCYGKFLSEGWGVGRDYKRSLEWFVKSKTTWSRLAMARLYFEGPGPLDKHESKAGDLIREVVNCLMQPRSTTRLFHQQQFDNQTASLMWYKDVLCEDELCMLSNKLLSPLLRIFEMIVDSYQEDFASVLDWITAEAESGDQIMQLTLALLIGAKCVEINEPRRYHSMEQIRNGRLIENEFTSHMEKWLVMAADKGSARARFYLSVMYAIGWNAVKSLAKSEEYLSQSYDQGYLDAKFMMALKYLHGWDNQQLSTKEGQLILNSLLGSTLDLNSRYVLGYFCFKYKRYQNAFEFLELPSENGHARAQYLLSFQYGQSGKRLSSQGLKLLEQSSSSGLPEAKYSLGVQFLRSDNPDLQKQKERGLKLITESAENGYEPAAHLLAWLHAHGILVDRPSRRESWRYYKMAFPENYKRFKEALGL